MEMEFEKYLKLKRLVDVYYDVQDVRTRTANRLLTFPANIKGLHPKSLESIEADLKLEIDQLLSDVPIWHDFLCKWRGIGPCLAGSLIATIMVRFVKREPTNDFEKQWSLKTKDNKTLVPEIRGIKAFANPSKLHAFAGLDVRNGKAPRKIRNNRESVTWSPKMRVISWKIGEQFVKQGRYYRDLYERFRQQYEARPDLQDGKGAKGHRYAMAKRKMVKQFLTDMWVAWRKLEGLSTVNPYVIDKLGHTFYIIPPPLGDREPAETFEPGQA
jgi:hypothetical protein